MCEVLTLQKTIAAKRIGKIVLTHLQPDALPVLRSLIHLIDADGSNPVDIIASAAAIRFLRNAFGNKLLLHDWNGTRPQLSSVLAIR